MDNLKKFEEFDWKFGFGKDKKVEDNPMNPINRVKALNREEEGESIHSYPIETPKEDDAILDKIIIKIGNNPNPANIRYDYVGDGVSGIIYFFPIYIFGVTSFGECYVQKRDEYVKDRDFETKLDVDDDKARELYDLLSDTIDDDSRNKVKSRKEDFRKHIMEEKRRYKNG